MFCVAEGVSGHVERYTVAEWSCGSLLLLYECICRPCQRDIACGALLPGVGWLLLCVY